MPIGAIIEHLISAAVDHSTSAVDYAPSAADHATTAADHATTAADHATTAADHAASAASHGQQFGMEDHDWVRGSSGVMYERIKGVYTGNYVNP